MLQSFLLENRAKSTASEHALEVQNKPALQGSPGISFSHLTESALTGLKQMSWTTTILLGLTGATAGVASGLLGIGGGTVVTPLLAMMTPLSQVSHTACMQTSSAGMLFTTNALISAH